MPVLHLISSDSWRKLRKNRTAVFGMVVIVLSFLLAALAYVVAPDHSPFANRMIVEIEGRKPGFSQQFLRLQKEPLAGRIQLKSR